MKSTGIVRKIDNLGRVVIPIELRKTMELTENDAVEIFTEGNSIIFKKYVVSCVFCGNSKEVVKYKDKCVCKKCISNLSTEK